MKEKTFRFNKWPTSFYKLFLYQFVLVENESQYYSQNTEMCQLRNNSFE